MAREQIAARGVSDARVIAAMRAVPRHRFVPQSVRDDAYEDRPLPIAAEQTIRQPYIVAPPRIPEPRKQQLKVGGRLVVPVGRADQELVVVTRTASCFEERRSLPVRFVPMTGRVQDDGDQRKQQP